MLTFEQLIPKSYDFLRGYYDCMYSGKHMSNQDEEYDQGYNTRYQEEQIAGCVINPIITIED